MNFFRTNEFKIIEEFYLTFHLILLLVFLNNGFPMYADSSGIFPKVYAIVFGLYTIFKIIRYFQSDCRSESFGCQGINHLFTVIDGLFFFTYISMNIMDKAYLSNFYYLFLVLQSIRYANKYALIYGLYSSLLYVLTEYFVEFKFNDFVELLVTIIMFQIIAYIISFSLRQLNTLSKEKDYYFNELQEKNSELERLAKTDFLTSLGNHQSFYASFECLKKDLAYNGKPISLALIDIDNFKIINDTYGHLIGDFVLKDLSKILKSIIRSKDYAARYGGEEFAIIFPNTDLNEAVSVCERIRKAIEGHVFRAEDFVLKITVSIGVNVLREIVEEDDSFQFINGVDSLLYEAKSLGKNKVLAPTK